MINLYKLLSRLFFIGSIFFIVENSSAQILQSIGDQLKAKAQQDAITALEKKGTDLVNNKRSKKNNTSQNTNNTQQQTNSSTKDNQDPGGPTSSEGFITVNISSTRVFAGGILTITGESGVYKNLKTVKVAITGPGTSDIKTINLKDSAFTCIWHASDKTGDFTVTATSSDSKATATKKFVVYKLSGLGDMASDNIAITKKALDQLNKSVDRAKQSLSTNDAEDLDKKFNDAKDKINQLEKFYGDINSAGKNLASSAKSGANISKTMANNLSKLNDQLQTDADQMKKVEEISNHEPYDKTICEYLVMINEAAAAFSTFGNIFPGTACGIVKSIALDKAVPLATDNEINGRIENSSASDATKESSKLFATAAFDGESLISKMGVAGFVGDMVQLVTNFLLKKYCGIMTGSAVETYKVEYRNQQGQDWWSYGYTTESVLTLRYPKDKGNGKIVKMKGTLEGHASSFDFSQDITKEDGFKEDTKGRVMAIPLAVRKPFCVKYLTDNGDKMGFGAVARAVVTPAYFNIVVDAEYDRDAQTIKLFLNDALIDFSALVENRVLFVTPIPLPLFRVQSFPIEKAKKTINAVVRRSKGYKVQQSVKGELSFTDKDQFHVGNASSDIEQTVTLSIKAKQQ